MIGVMIIPTGLGCEIGGHAGDANPACKLIAACCDKLIIHPNVVNASDVNEQADNCLYVEGSILDRSLEGKILLEEVYRNNILVVVNPPLSPSTLNAVGSARATIGCDARVVELKTPLKMVASKDKGKATGDVYGWKELVEQVKEYDFDVLAIHTPIEVHRDIAYDYYQNGGVNPWGGVEAKASKLIANAINKPVAHAPLEYLKKEDEELYYVQENMEVDPRIAPEAISACYLHCVMKGLNTAPVISDRGLCVCQVDFLLSPMGCWGRPHRACHRRGIPIVMVEQNTHQCIIKVKEDTIKVNNYLEAAGWIMSLAAGVLPSTVIRPLQDTSSIRVRASGQNKWCECRCDCKPERLVAA